MLLSPVLASHSRPSRQLSIITDYIPGWNLAELTAACIQKTGAPLPEAALAGIAGQLMRALVLLHSNQVIHRDIKPTSILIQRDGLVRITGLGNAHLSSRDSFSGAGAPHGNSMVGTPWSVASACKLQPCSCFNFFFLGTLHLSASWAWPLEPLSTCA